MIKQIKHILKAILRYFFLDLEIPRVYKKAAAQPVDKHKIVFIEVRFPEITDSFRLLYDALKTREDLTIKEHYFLNFTASLLSYRKRVLAAVKDMATAGVVFINDASTAVAAVPLRAETKLINVWHACGAFKKFGLSTAELLFGDDAKEQQKHPNYGHQTLVTVSAPEVVWAYEEAMGIVPDSGVVQPLGISRTDMFYDKRFIHDAKERVYSAFPQARGKKIILYAPTFRGRVKEAVSPDKLDINAFYEAFCDEYVLMFKHHPFVQQPPVIPQEYADFAYDATKSLPIEALLCAADICISDYSSLVFEYSLFEKPIIFFAYDLKEYFDWRGFYYDYNDLAPGLIAETNEEMIDYIQHINERFDRAAVQAFRQKFMSACDGHATDRIIEYALN